jgi:hypothetical protein
MPTKFEDWLKDQTDEIKSMFEEHVSGLKTALQSERDLRKDDLKELKKLRDLTEKGSDAESKLTGMVDKLENTELRVKFYESATDAGIKNLKAAFLLAQADGLVSKEKIDFDGLKASYPEMFGSEPQPKGNAGEGSNQGNNTGKADMNEWIRTRVQ